MKRRLPPDNRPDWRDPNMPVDRNYVLGDGTVLPTVPPDYESSFRRYLITVSSAPNFRSDPTYNLRRKDK